MGHQKEKETPGKTYLAVAALVCALFFLLCAGKGIVPFGSSTIDTVDFGSQWVPAYYHVWDFLHGKGSLFFDWKVTGGNNFAGAASQFSLISPFNLLLLLVGRNQIQPFMTFFICVKLVAMGLSMCFFLQSQQKERASSGFLKNGRLWIVAGSTAYALSGYTFQYYGMGWPDAAAVFPLLIYNLVGMARKERGFQPGKHTFGYLLCLTLIFVINIPQAYMTCFFLILFAGGYFFLLREEGAVNQEGILKFGVTSLLSLGLSAVFFLPAAVAILTSSRLSGEEYTGENGYFWLLRQSGMDPQAKWYMLLGVLIPLLYLVFTTRKKRSCLWQSYLVLLMVLPVVFEAVNLMWHRGTYMCFPMRHGYMMIFAVLAMAFERYTQRGQTQRNGIASGIAAALWGAITLGLGAALLTVNPHGGTIDFVRDAEEVGEALAGESDVFHKVKIADASLDSNYPLIADVSSYSNYLHLMTKEQIALSRGLGYSQIWTRISDTGGTLFSDALLGYCYTVHRKETQLAEGVEESVYGTYKETEHFNLLTNPYVYGPGLRLDLEAYRQLDQTISNNVFENQNRLSVALFGEAFFDAWTETFADEKASERLTYHIPVEEKRILYFYSKELSGAEILVNGKKLPVPGYTDLQGTRYLSDYNNGILNLGCFAGEEVEVEIRQTCYGTGIPKEIQFALFDLEAFTDSVQLQRSRGEEISYELGKHSCRLSATAQQEEFLLLPINADGGWHLSINGKEEGIATLYGNLMLIQLKPGENEILLSYTPRGFSKGAAVTLLALVLLAVWIALAKVKAVKNVLGKCYHIISYAAVFVFAAVFAGFLVIVYVIPIGDSLWRWFLAS